MERYDIVIIGTGPAGLSAAITAKVRNKKILLVGSKDLSPKVEKAHMIQNYLGLPSVSGEKMAEAFQQHLDDMGIEVAEKKINTVYAMGDYFGIQAGTEMFEADSVILATGVTTDKPLPGENEFLGRGVSYCATCDTALYRGRTVAIIGYGPKEEAEADFLAEVVGKVYYIPMYKEPYHLAENVEIIQEKPLEIVGAASLTTRNGQSEDQPVAADFANKDFMQAANVAEDKSKKKESASMMSIFGDKVGALRTDGGEYPVDCVFVLRESILPEHLVPGLELEENHVKVDLQMRTNIPGCFACGDIAGKPYQYIKAAGQGNVAALSAVEYLSKRRGMQTAN